MSSVPLCYILSFYLFYLVYLRKTDKEAEDNREKAVHGCNVNKCCCWNADDLENVLAFIC